MRYIAENTSIPVPKVYCAFKHKGTVYIVMERLEGEYIGRGWGLKSEETRANILSQIKGMMKELRNIPCPKGIGIANVDGGSIYDQNLPQAHDRNRFGPFRDVAGFHSYLRNGMDKGPPKAPEVCQLIYMHSGDWSICFTHGDLSSLNIMAKGDKVTGIIDWETAGWYPSYWEYVSTCNTNPQNAFWREEVDNILEPMPKELAMDQLRLKYFGMFPWFSKEDLKE